MIKRIIKSTLIVLAFVPVFSQTGSCAPCYGTRMPGKDKWHCGYQAHDIFRTELKNDQGSMRSVQGLFLLSRGLFEGLSIDAKIGVGGLRYKRPGRPEIDYKAWFCGGYGFRIRLGERAAYKTVFGFQHISAHPRRAIAAGERHKAILDDWQFSWLCSRDFKRGTPYVGLRFGRKDYLYLGEVSRKRTRSDMSRALGLVVGSDVALTQRSWLNLEGQAINGEAFSISYNFKL